MNYFLKKKIKINYISNEFTVCLNFKFKNMLQGLQTLHVTENYYWIFNINKIIDMYLYVRL